jgi:hypothetical protein
MYHYQICMQRISVSCKWCVFVAELVGIEVFASLLYIG